jgi:PhzF family phenazine biosynthesis protein
MGRRLRIFRVDAFTDTACAGNPACVVLDGEFLEEPAMLALTRELGGVDVAFVLPPDGIDGDLKVRFFTPRAETGLVGHATVAVHAVLDALGRPPARRQQQRGGIVEIERLSDAEGALYGFSQPLPARPGPLPGEQLTAILSALDLDTEALDPQLPAMVAGIGGNRALIGLRSGTSLVKVRPDLQRLAALSAAGCPTGYFLYSVAPAIAGCDSEARMFCPALGFPEDPVSGNAHALLAAHFSALGRFRDRLRAGLYTGRQGHHMGRPGMLTVRLTEQSAGSEQVRVAGRARIVFEATLDLG